MARHKRRIVETDEPCPVCGEPVLVDQLTVDGPPDHVCINGHTWTEGKVVRHTNQFSD